MLTFLLGIQTGVLCFVHSKYLADTVGEKSYSRPMSAGADDCMPPMVDDFGSSYIKEVNIPREVIKLSPISSAIIPHKLPDGHLSKTGYVKLATFSQTAALEMENTVHEVESQGVQSYILDLRNNPVSLFYVDLLDLFNEVEFQTASGQMIDLITTIEGERICQNTHYHCCMRIAHVW
ncbi:hypothetical protein ABFS83_12G045800 [Erythranthe nasuta]